MVPLLSTEEGAKNKKLPVYNSNSHKKKTKYSHFTSATTINDIVDLQQPVERKYLIYL